MTASDTDYELSRARAHPRARNLMVEPWFWDTGDDDAPFGNDTGADTLHLFLQQRANSPRLDPLEFLTKHLRSWQVLDGGWAELESARLSQALPSQHFHILTRDDSVIALAFAQFAIEGTIQSVVRERAIWAVRRQAMDQVIKFRNWADPKERVHRLGRMEAVLTEARRKAV